MTLNMTLEIAILQEALHNNRAKILTTASHMATEKGCSWFNAERSGVYFTKRAARCSANSISSTAPRKARLVFFPKCWKFATRYIPQQVMSGALAER
jgi:hypothetical protein